MTLWAADSLTAPAREVTSPSLVYSAPQFLPDGSRFLLLEATKLPTRGWEFRRVIRSADTGEVVGRSDPLADDPDEMVLSPDGTTAACRTRNAIRVYPETGEPVVIANDGKQHFTGIAYHPSGRLLAATSNDRTVKLYDAESGQVSKVFTWDVGRMRSVAFGPDGLTAAAGSDTGKVVVWDVDG